MPMDFPDMQSLINRAQQRGFRQLHEGEEEPQYRAAFASFMRDVDMVESIEIAQGRGWDRIDPFTMLSSALGGEDKLSDLMNSLNGDESANNEPEVKSRLPLPEYPHLMITCAKDEEIFHLYDSKEAEEVIELLAVFMATSPVVRTQEIFKTQITEIESMSAAASRAMVSRMLRFIEEGNENPVLQKLANSLASRMLVMDVPLNVSISKLLEASEEYEGDFVLPV